MKTNVHLKHQLPFLFWALCFVGANQIFAQNNISLEDYNRAVAFTKQDFTRTKVFNLEIRPNWIKETEEMWYLYRNLDGKKYLKVDLTNLRKSDLFDHAKMAQELSKIMDEEVKSNNLPISTIAYKGPDELNLTVRGKTYTFNRKSYKIQAARSKPPRNNSEAASPNKEWIAYVEDYNLFLKSSETGAVKQLSTTGEKGYEYASYLGWADIMKGENADRPDHFSVQWSKDSKWIFTNIVDLRTARKMYLLDWSIDTLYRPELLSYYRGSPGDTNMVYYEPVIFNVETGAEIKLDLPRATHINNIEMVPSKDSDKVFLIWSTRGYQNFTINVFDLESQKKEILYTESSPTNIDNFWFDFAEESGYLLFLSEKSGWRQLYRLDLKTGEEQMLTEGGFYINGVTKIDQKTNKVFFRASGKEAGRNPYYQGLYSISFNGENFKSLTQEQLHHNISLAPNAKYFVDNYSTINIPTTSVLRDANTGEVLIDLGIATTPGLKNWSPPEIFTAVARDGKTTIYGAFWKPSNFDPNKSYPVLEYSYTGPHTQVFPKRFGQAFYYQSFAELGFIVVMIDGLGSSGRSKAFHDYSYKNLGGNLEDHVLAIRQLGQKYSWVDTSRVGIFGHSAGGYDAAHALLAYPDFYKVAVASSADHDHRMEKAWWPEMYMGWPVDSAYHLQSNITMAGNLKGKLLITHGGIDENVNPSATFKLAEALIKADKQFDMLILPSQRHGYRGAHGRYFNKVRWNYFVKHLRGAEPIWDFEW
ncbi:MAG: prolyl oligopeptidase family serine peptidase [Bacteroidota bacterium]